MKIYYILFIFIFTINNVGITQQIPTPDNYVFQPKLYNPAYLGGLKYTEIFGGYQTQWGNIGIDERPTTQYLVLNTNIFTNNGQAQSLLDRIGLGGYFLSDKIGIIKQTRFALGLSYFIISKEDLKLSGGFSIGGWNQGIDFMKMTLRENADRTVWNSNLQGTQLDINFGTQLMIKLSEKNTLNVGGTLMQLTTKPIYYESTGNIAYAPNVHLLSSLGLNMKLGKQEKIILNPLMLYQGIISGENKNIGGGNVDLALQLRYELTEKVKLSIGGGVKANIEATTPIGVYALGKLDYHNLTFQISNRQHSLLGNSTEIGVGMRFNKNPSKKGCVPNEEKISSLVKQSDILIKESDEFITLLTISEEKIRSIRNDVIKDFYCLSEMELKEKLEEIDAVQEKAQITIDKLQENAQGLNILKENSKQYTCSEGDRMADELTVKLIDLSKITNIEHLTKEIDNKIGTFNTLKQAYKNVDDFGISNTITSITCSTIKFEYNDSDYGNYIVNNKKYFKVIQQIVEEVQASQREIESLSITFFVEKTVTELKQKTTVSYNGENIGKKEYDVADYYSINNLEVGQDVDYEKLNALKIIGLRYGLTEKINNVNENDVKTKFNRGQKNIDGVKVVIEMTLK